MFVESLQSVLSADTGIKSQLGTPGTRSDQTTGIFPVVALSSAEVTMPYMVYQQISGEPTTTSFQGTNRLQTQRWRFSCHGSTYKQAKQLAKYLKLALISLDGTMPAGNAEVHGAWLRLEADDIEPIPHGTIFTTHVDCEFTFLDYDTD